MECTARLERRDVTAQWVTRRPTCYRVKHQKSAASAVAFPDCEGGSNSWHAFLSSPLALCSCSARNAGAQERPEPAAKDATVFGFKLHYLDAGRGQPVILLHGTGGEGARWMPTIRALAPEFRVIAPDQIGFGQSDKPLTTYHSGVFAGFLARFMQAIGVPKASLVGQSMGAQVALSLAVQYPQLVDRLVLVNGGGFRSGPAASNTAPPDWYARQIANAGTLSESREYLEKLYYDHSLSPTNWWSAISSSDCARRIRLRACRWPATEAWAA